MTPQSPTTMKKLKLTLTLDVEYDLDGATPIELRERLSQIWDDAYALGTVTDDLAATIDSYKIRIAGSDDLVQVCAHKYGPAAYDAPRDPSTIQAWLRNIPVGSEVCIDDDGLRLQVVGNDEIFLEIGGPPDPDKTPLTVDDFVDRLGSIGEEAIIPEVHYRLLCQEADDDRLDEDRPCKLEVMDKPAFRQGMNDYADGMQKDHQWATFDNGNCYYTAEQVKAALAEFDGDDDEYEMTPELKNIIDFWL